MVVRDAEISQSVEKLKALYQNLRGNVILRKRMNDSQVPREVWTNVDDLLLERQHVQTNEYSLERLYQQILALVSLYEALRDEIAPSLKKTPSGYVNAMEQGTRMLFKMTVGNLDLNLKNLADLTGELYMKAVQADKAAAAGRTAVYERTKGLSEVGRKLVS